MADWIATLFFELWLTQAVGSFSTGLDGKNGQTLGEQCCGLNVTAESSQSIWRSSRGKPRLVGASTKGLHFINLVPVNEIAQRRIGKFERQRLSILSAHMKTSEGENHE